jgi:hypothetical protein
VKNSIVIRPNATATAEQARHLLRRFRDLNLGPCGIEVSDGGRVVVAGCLSVDHPVESGVRYCLQDEDGERVLRIHWSEDQLLLQLSPTDDSQAQTPDELGVPLACDGLGRVSAPELGARLHLEEAGAIDIEHFLRRIVRAVYSQAG